MANSFKNMMREVMAMAHRAFELKSATMSWSECLKQAWAVLKLKLAMKKRVVEFYFQKVDGSIRQAFGTLQESLIDYTPMVRVMLARIVLSTGTLRKRLGDK